MKSNEQLRKEFEEQTGNKAIVFPACHGETGYASWEYQLWLEQKLLEEYAQQSQPSGMRWVKASERLPDKYKTIVMRVEKMPELTGNGYSDGNVFWWSGPKKQNIYYNIQDVEWLSESSPAGAAEGASEGISKIREVMNWISQCVDEDHDLEVSEIKMIWNDLSDAISLIESTPHSSEGMAEALRKDIFRLDELRRFHIEPYNLGEMGEVSKIISRLSKLASLSPGVEDGSGAVKDETISDGFGGEWLKKCPDCGKDEMAVVRPGKVQCNNCG